MYASKSMGGGGKLYISILIGRTGASMESNAEFSGVLMCWRLKRGPKARDLLYTFQKAIDESVGV